MKSSIRMLLAAVFVSTGAYATKVPIPIEGATLNVSIQVQAQALLGRRSIKTVGLESQALDIRLLPERGLHPAHFFGFCLGHCFRQELGRTRWCCLRRARQ